MKKPRKPGPAKPRNPHARALGSGLFRAKAEKARKAYVRRPKHAKPAKTEDPEP